MQVVQVHEDYCLAQRVVRNTEFNKIPLGSSLPIISQMNDLTTTVESVVPINSDETKQVLDLSKLTNTDMGEGDICIIMSNSILTLFKYIYFIFFLLKRSDMICCLHKVEVIGR